MDVSRMSHAGPPLHTAARRPTPSRSLSAAIGDLGFEGALNRQLRVEGAPAPVGEARPGLTPQRARLQAGPTLAIAREAAEAPKTSAETETTPSGAPKIVLNAERPPGSEYTGPAALNPYFSTSSHPLAPGAVQGFQNWFQTIQVGQPGELGSYAWTPKFSATAEGAQEALRIVEQFMPGCKIQPFYYTGQVDGQPASHAVKLPNGDWMNAGLILDSYYMQGWGVSALSDRVVREELMVLTGGSAGPAGVETGWKV